MRYTLQELRAKKKMSQSDMANVLGVSTQTYNAWEKNFGKIQVTKANEIANYFDLTLDDIFFSQEHE